MDLYSEHTVYCVAIYQMDRLHGPEDHNAVRWTTAFVTVYPRFNRDTRGMPPKLRLQQHWNHNYV